MSDEKKLLGMIGMCRRAGKAVIGVPMICEHLRKRGVVETKDGDEIIVLEASDSSDNTHKKIADKSAFYQVRVVRIDCDGATLASALGKTSSLAAVAIKDKEMCKIVEKYI